MSYSLLKDGGLYERGGEAEEPGAGPAHQEGLPAGEGDRQAAPPWHRDQQAPPSGLDRSELSGLADTKYKTFIRKITYEKKECFCLFVCLFVC